MIGIPAILIILIEFTLTVTNVGNNYSTFIKLSGQFSDYLVFNPDIPRKYFSSSKIIPSVIPDGFKKIKDKNTFRIFALGGSTTAGFPFPPNMAFPRILKQKLKRQFLHKNFDVINLGISAVNSITIRDLIDDVLKQSPDLIIIYAGHNEYYGALGPASNMSIFDNHNISRIIVGIRKFRIVQLTEKFISNLFNVFSDNKSKSNSTLMAELASGSLVSFESDKYYSGISQFRDNLDDILLKSSEYKTKTIICTLASNLEQQPLCTYSGCDSLNQKFQEAISNDTTEQKSMLQNIKDIDALRFRAPEIFNTIINEISTKHGVSIVDIQGIFEDVSPNEIIGHNLMVDHLHPNSNGTKLIAESLFHEIVNMKIVSEVDQKSFSDKLSSNLINYSEASSLDSVYAQLRNDYLKFYFPFSNRKRGKYDFKGINISSKSDYAALELFRNQTSWKNAHLNLAEEYLNQKNYQSFVKEMNVIIQDRPFDIKPYIAVITELLNVKENLLAKDVLLQLHALKPSYYSSKKLGNIYFSDKLHNKAIYYYRKSLEYSKIDPEIFYNLSASYFSRKDLEKALNAIIRCLEIDPNYPNASRIRDGLVKIYSTRK